MGLDIITRKEWGARYGDGDGNRPLPATEAWLHHSATIAPDLHPPYDDDDAAVRTLEAIGQQRFGRGISYTYAVTPVGRVYQGHSIGRRGSHTVGHNTVGVAIVLVQDCRKLAPTAVQVEHVARLLVELHRNGWLSRHTLNGGHTQASGNSTDCPTRNGLAAVPVINARADVLWAAGYPSTDVPEEDDMFTDQDRKVLNYISAQAKAVAELNIELSKREAARDAAWQSAITQAVSAGGGAIDADAVRQAVEDALAGYSLTLTHAPQEVPQ